MVIVLFRQAALVLPLLAQPEAEAGDDDLRLRCVDAAVGKRDTRWCY